MRRLIYLPRLICVASRIFCSARLLALLLLLFLPAGGWSQQERLYRLYTQARQAQQTGDLAAAAKYYESIVQLQPELAEAFANLGTIYYQLRDEERARKALQRAVELKPALGAPHFFLGLIETRKRNYQQAITHYQETIKLGASNPAVHFYLGAAYYATNDYQKAIKHFEKAGASDEYRTDAYYHLSKSYSHLSKNALTKLQSRYPDSFFAVLAQANYYESEKNWEEARRAYEKLAQIRPDAGGIQTRLDWVAAHAAGEPPQTPAPDIQGPSISGSLRFLYSPPEAGDLAPLIEEYKQRIKGLGRHSISEEKRLHMRAENYQALSYLTALWIVEKEPASYRAHQLKGQMHEVQGEPEKAIEEYRRALELKPNLENVHFAIGSLYWTNEQPDQALPELRAELEINPNHPEAHYEIADILSTRGQQSEAKKHLLECLRLEPAMQEAHLAIEKIYFAEGQFDKALEHLQTLAKLSPNDPTPHYRMSLVYRKLGKRDLVQRELEIFQQLRNDQ